MAWITFVDPASGAEYYHDPETQETTWEMPDALRLVAPAVDVAIEWQWFPPAPKKTPTSACMQSRELEAAR